MEVAVEEIATGFGLSEARTAAEEVAESALTSASSTAASGVESVIINAVPEAGSEVLDNAATHAIVDSDINIVARTTATFGTETAVKEAETAIVTAVETNTVRDLGLLSTNAITKEELTNVVTNALSKDAKFSSFWENLLTAANAAKSILFAGVAVVTTATISAWIVSYIKQHNGPRIIVRRNGKIISDKRIRDPYPCGFTNKNGEVIHPLDRHIQRYARDKICNDLDVYGPCGGWTDFSSDSRFAKLVGKKFTVLVKKFVPIDTTFECRKVTVTEALGALSHEVGKAVGTTVVGVASGLASGLHINLEYLKIFGALVCSALSSFYIVSSSMNNFLKVIFLLTLAVIAAVFLLYK